MGGREDKRGLGVRMEIGGGASLGLAGDLGWQSYEESMGLSLAEIPTSQREI